MTRSEILEQIKEIFVETLDNEEITVEESTKAIDIDEWDSLMHVLLVDAMEKHFEVRFKASEIQDWKDVSEIIDSISHNLN
ncbi:acyl carrier protein [Ulvibacterium marinum]|uniref:Acyl carrier protein n=1 Tax=Ulvibacterium marinum TaxID=2419782 RepID=A0A3B0BZY3_9FLAO|nr:acyl carrier protein [Ulvibacterium marinum]RKN76936.1 acyl carrier protein [Ulvibacterium marinum]